MQVCRALHSCLRSMLGCLAGAFSQGRHGYESPHVHMSWR